MGIVKVDQNLYVTDWFNHVIRKIVIATGQVTTMAGNGIHGFTDGIGAAASFYLPVGITSDGTSLYVTDMGNNVIRKVVIATCQVSTLSGNGSYGLVDGLATAASFNYLWGITTDAANLYVADRDSHAIRKIVIATAQVTTLSISGIYSPTVVNTDGANLYVEDNNAIKKIEIATGQVTTLAGSNAMGFANGRGGNVQRTCRHCR
jgi:hypothetical protein